MTHQANRVIEKILNDKLDRYRKASAWVHDEAKMEATDEVLMGELVSGDLRTIERCLGWLQGCDVPLPAVPKPSGKPRAWSLQIDARQAADLDDETRGWLHAMDHLLFEGPQPEASCPVWASLSAIGLPPGLREDLQGPACG